MREPELLIPRHVHKNGKFKSFALPNFYSRIEITKRRKRTPAEIDSDKLHLVLPFNAQDHHIELLPYHDFISPEMVIETRGYGNDLNERLRFQKATDDQCYYRGFIKGHRNSRAALALCNGVVTKIYLFFLFFFNILIYLPNFFCFVLNHNLLLIIRLVL